jgi:hypothetical protein
MSYTNAKNLLAEKYQILGKNNTNYLPKYKSKIISGSDHNPIWICEINLYEGRTYIGEPQTTKSGAELSAAQKALEMEKKFKDELVQKKFIDSLIGTNFQPKTFVEPKINKTDSKSNSDIFNIQIAANDSNSILKSSLKENLLSTEQDKQNLEKKLLSTKVSCKNSVRIKDPVLTRKIVFVEEDLGDQPMINKSSSSLKIKEDKVKDRIGIICSDLDINRTNGNDYFFHHTEIFVDVENRTVLTNVILNSIKQHNLPIGIKITLVMSESFPTWEKVDKSVEDLNNKNVVVVSVKGSPGFLTNSSDMAITILASRVTKDAKVVIVTGDKFATLLTLVGNAVDNIDRFKHISSEKDVLELIKNRKY